MTSALHEVLVLLVHLIFKLAVYQMVGPYGGLYLLVTVCVTPPVLLYLLLSPDD